MEVLGGIVVVAQHTVSSMNPAGTGTGPWPRWMPSFMQIHRSTLAPGERLPPRDHECVAWRRVSEKDSGHVLWNGPVAETLLEYVNSHPREVMVSEWWCPGGFYRALQMVDFNAPIIGFDHQGNESSLGPFWAGRSGSILEQIHEDQEEIPNAGHQTELQRCHHRLNLLARHARREHHSSVHDLDFVELFSPPRVIPHAQRAGLKVDSSHVFDLQHGWDVRKLSHRRAFRQYRKKRRPRMMMASPACKAFTHLRHIYQERMDPETCRRTVAEGHLMWNFAMEACEEQIAEGNFFGLEHPRLAASWRLPRTQRLLQRDDVVLMSFDQCFFGLSVVPSGTLSRKSTCIATNNPWLALELVNAVCRGDHDHETLIGGLPRKAQEYPAELCSAIARGAQAVALGLNPPSFLESAEVYELTSPGCWFGEEEEEAEDETNPPNEPEQYTAPVSDSQRRLVQKVHVNTGHPDRLRMLRAFKAAGALPQVLRYIREEFGCEDCQLKRGPDNRRRAQLPRTFSFNRVLCADFLFIRFKECQIPIMNLTCAGTSYQIAVRCRETKNGTPTSAAAWRLFMDSWVRYFGAPHLLVTDSGNEFRGAFERGLEFQGILQHAIHPECPWQNGKAERHGGWLKDRLDSELQSGRCVFTNLEELDEFIAAILSTKNRWLNKGGFTPAQLVFGELPRIPGELLAEDELGLHGLHDAHEDPAEVDEAAGEYRRRHQIRERARQLAMTQASREAIRRSRHAAPQQQRHWAPGQWVYVFRRARGNQDLHLRDRWVGPGVVVVANNDTIYVGMRTRLWRCSPGQLRAALPSEVLGRELATSPGLSELLRQVVAGTHAGAVDVQREGLPGPEDMLGPVHRIEEGVAAASSAPSQQPAVLPSPQELIPPTVEAVPPGLLPLGHHRGERMHSIAEEEERPSHDPTMEELPHLSRRSSVNEPASEPGEQPQASGPGPPALPDDPSVPAEPPLKMVRTTSPEHVMESDPPSSSQPSSAAAVEPAPPETRAPGTPIADLMRRIPRAVSPPPGLAEPHEGAHLTPVEELPQQNRVPTQVEEFNRLAQRRDHDRADDSGLWGEHWFHIPQDASALCLELSGEWVQLPKRGGEISLKELSLQEKEQFDKSDELEWSAVLGTGAVKVIVGKAASKAREDWPDRIISSRMVRRKKPQPELNAWKAKSRWCIHGHHDPDTGTLCTYSPTPSTEGLMTFLQTGLNFGMKFAFSDVKNAFCQSDKLNRPRGPLFAEPCEGLHLPEGALIEILVPTYGLDDAPREWRLTVTRFLASLSFEKNLVEPCWYTLFSDKRECLAQVLVEVDDFIVCAAPDHYDWLKSELTKRFHFGKWEEDEAEYAGRHIRVMSDSIHVDQSKYIQEQVKPIPLAKGRRSTPDDLLSKEEFNLLRSLVFKINWLARESRPEASGLASLMAGRLPNAQVSDVQVVNKYVNFLRSTHDRPLKIWRFHPENVCFVVCSDAGGINMKGVDQVDHEGLPLDATQGAWMVLAAERLPEGNRAVRASPITWRSSRLKRKVFSTFGGETQAMLQGVNEVDWLQVMYRDATKHDVSLSCWRNSLSPHMLIMRGQCSLADRQGQCSVTDAKSLYDCLLRENPSGKQDRKSALELAIILRDLQDTKSMVRWVPHQKMLVDCMTKLDPSRANDALNQFVKSGWLSLVDVPTELKHRRDDPAYKRRSHAASSKRLEYEEQHRILMSFFLSALVNGSWGNCNDSPVDTMIPC